MPAQDPPAAAREAEGLFEAVLSPIRRQLLVALCSTGGASVSALQAQLTLTRTLTSRHLNILKVRGFVRDRREGQQVWYTAIPDRVRYETTPANTP